MHKLNLKKQYLHIEIKQLGTQRSHEKFQNMETIQKCFELVQLYGSKMWEDKPP
jgi:hypothetical protein